MHGKKEAFIRGLGVDYYKKRVHLRDAIGYAECLECGGNGPTNPTPGKRRAVEIISKWNAKTPTEIRLDADTIQAVVDWAYGPGSIRLMDLSYRR